STRIIRRSTPAACAAWVPDQEGQGSASGPAAPVPVKRAPRALPRVRCLAASDPVAPVPVKRAPRALPRGRCLADRLSDRLVPARTASVLAASLLERRATDRIHRAASSLRRACRSSPEREDRPACPERAQPAVPGPVAESIPCTRLSSQAAARGLE